jgi:glyoxalase family protein
LPEANPVETAALLTNTMGFKLVGEDGGRFRYAADSGESAALVDVVPASQPGRILAGTVHHIAWRTRDDQQQLKWLDELTRLRYGVSPVKDRKYFHSIYFREPGGILFEIATDPPGFAVDEAPEELGTKLVLPPWLEPERAKLQAVLPPVRLPTPQEAAV